MLHFHFSIYVYYSIRYLGFSLTKLNVKDLLSVLYLKPDVKCTCLYLFGRKKSLADRQIESADPKIKN